MQNIILSLVFLILIPAAIGAAEQSPTAAPDEPADRFYKEGKKLYKEFGCVSCHTLDGKGGLTGGPLDGAAERGRKYIRQVIIDPTSIDHKSRMPSFARRLTVDQVDMIVDYLMNRKPDKQQKPAEEDNPQ